jgi:Protein of unknown function (DUF2905)
VLSGAVRGPECPMPFHLGKMLVVAGVVLVGVGLLLMAGSRFSFLGFGRLPGDIVYKGKYSAFYFPIVSCLILSVVLTLAFWLFSVLTRK